MNNLFENWRRYIKEEVGAPPYEEIQSIIDSNPYLKGKIEANETTVHDLGDKYLLMSGVTHIAERHQDKCFPGSLFLLGDDAIMEAILNVVRDMPAEIGKALAVPSGIEGLGMERLQKIGPEKISDFEDYTMNDGTIVKVVREGDNPGVVTDRLTVIAPKIGEADGVPVVSLVTAFPGFMGTGHGGSGDIEIKDRAEFTKNGYYFSIPEECPAQTVDEQNEPFQRAVRAKHPEMKKRLTAHGPNEHGLDHGVEKTSNKRSKSAPPGAGG
jgi:hypothetical protein